MLDHEKLMDEAKRISTRAYAPYSNFRVGAALLCSDGSIVTGVNVENRSFGLTNCAERTAIFSAVCQGKTDFTALAIYSPDSKGLLPPCGACRQVISEFTQQDFTILLWGENGLEKYSMKEIFPLDSLHHLKDQID